MKEPNLIKVYSGQDIQGCTLQMHPLTEVELARMIVDSNRSIETFSNSPDFVSAIKNYADKKGRKVEYFLNNVSCGNDPEPIFKDFNRAIERINEICE